MTTPALLAAMTVGGAALALWAYLRLGTLAPEGIRSSMFHVAVSLAAVYLLAPLLMQPIIGDGESPGRIFTALFAVFLPALVYTFLSGLWAFAVFARALRPH